LDILAAGANPVVEKVGVPGGVVGALVRRTGGGRVNFPNPAPPAEADRDPAGAEPAAPVPGERTVLAFATVSIPFLLIMLVENLIQ
jgi:hypothetical protein